MERVNELGNRTIEMTQSEQCRENRPKKMNLWDYNKGSKGSLHWSHSRDRRKRTGLKKILKEIMAENIPNVAKDLTVESRSWANPKQDKSKEIHSKTHHSQTSKN